MSGTAAGIEKRRARGWSANTTPLAERFWAKVDKAGPIHSELGTACWLWTGANSSTGYGAVFISVLWTRNGKRSSHTKRANRVSWELAHGAIDSETLVLHRCDNPPCVNPAHLFIGTTQDNVADREAKGRTSRRSTHGELSVRARLTDAIVVDARRRRRAGEGYASMARSIGVDTATIRKACIGKTWNHIPDPVMEKTR